MRISNFSISVWSENISAWSENVTSDHWRSNSINHSEYKVLQALKAFWRLITVSKDEVKDSVKIKNTSSVLYLKMKLRIWIANGPKWHPEQRLTRSFHSKFTCKVTWWATASNLPPLKLDSPLFEHVFTFRFHLDSLHFRILLKCSQNNFLCKPNRPGELKLQLLCERELLAF